MDEDGQTESVENRFGGGRGVEGENIETFIAIKHFQNIPRMFCGQIANMGKIVTMI